MSLSLRWVGSIQAFIRRDSGDRRFACVARVARTPTARGSERSGFEEAIRKEIRDQKINFRPNCMMRAGQALSTAPRSWPPLEPVQGSPNPVLPRQPLFTSLYCVWLKVLNVSQRNCMVECSPLNQGRAKFLSNAIPELLR